MRVYVQLYRGDMLVARVTLPSCCLEEVRQLVVVVIVEREIDARGGSQWSRLVRDRLAFPSLLLLLSLRLAGLCLCFAWTHDARSFHAEQRPECALL